ncbi:PREDICTED: biogenesis of lysosome-related organelles complex 1 subunit 5 isoform X1 [Chinchilla lanigera]|uniref:Biogenesis of lysosome-related organelles complex 1 subunit 5 n=1 Tax=Chinchilla lanigera TaxID=34839 RepID=A0A8C2UN89_CHILA|nr:PREDICTED: biogenesis of lysosome-related organelles complex 1 subunit 5 isoform X1 [Chinchilla lanigera]
MSGAGTETPVGCEAAPGGSGGKKRDSLGTASSAHLIIKDLGEIQSRLLDHRPVIQGETRYFVKEFEEKRGLREMRVLENLKNMIRETNEHTVPECRDAMESSLKDVLQRLQAANDSVRRLQEKEQERRKMYNDHLVASEKQHQLQWEELMREEPHRRAAVDEEHRRAVERLREQYAEMEKDLSKFATF